MILPVYHVFFLFIISSVIVQFGKKRAVWILLAAFAIQLIDVAAVLRAPPQTAWIKLLNTPFWTTVAKHYDKVAVVTDDDPFKNWFPISLFAADNGLRMNAGYFARRNDQVAKEELFQMISDLNGGNLDSKTLYIIPEDKVGKIKIPGQKTNETGYGVINFYNIVAPGWFSFSDTDSATQGMLHKLDRRLTSQ
jgi:hypothetical protein